MAGCLALPLPLSKVLMRPLLSSRKWPSVALAILLLLLALLVLPPLLEEDLDVEVLTGVPVDDAALPFPFSFSFFVPKLIPHNLLLLFCSLSFPSGAPFAFAGVTISGSSPDRIGDVTLSAGDVLPAGLPVMGSRPTALLASASKSTDPCCAVYCESTVEAVDGRTGEGLGSGVFGCLCLRRKGWFGL